MTSFEQRLADLEQKARSVEAVLPALRNGVAALLQGGREAQGWGLPFIDLGVYNAACNTLIPKTLRVTSTYMSTPATLTWDATVSMWVGCGNVDQGTTVYANCNTSTVGTSSAVVFQLDGSAGATNLALKLQLLMCLNSFQPSYGSLRQSSCPATLTGTNVFGTPPADASAWTGGRGFPGNCSPFRNTYAIGIGPFATPPLTIPFLVEAP